MLCGLIIDIEYEIQGLGWVIRQRFLISPNTSRFFFLYAGLQLQIRIVIGFKSDLRE